MAKSGDYYDECTEHKQVKSEIASAYLYPWAKIVGQKKREIHYLDLFSGRGKFIGGEHATPLLIFDTIQEAAKEIPWIFETLHVSFFEGKKDFFEVLDKSLKAHPVYSQLKHKPIIENKKINAQLIDEIARDIKTATYSFIDPFGYNISLDLIDLVSKKWGCDCLFYLSISGLVRNIQEPEKEKSIKQFFGEESYYRIIQAIEERKEETSLSSIILSEIKQSLRIRRTDYRVIKYCVEYDNKRRESHYLMFISKSPLGIKIMRDIMMQRATIDNQGYPFLGLSPKMKLQESQTELPLGFPSDILATFSNRLLSDFRGREIRIPDLLEDCLEKEYPMKDSHIRKVLEFLEKKEKVKISRFDRFGKQRNDTRIQKHDIISFLR